MDTVVSFFTSPQPSHALVGTVAFVFMWGTALGRSVVNIVSNQGLRRFIPLFVTILWGYLLFDKPTPAILDFTAGRAHPAEAALRTTCMAILFIWFVSQAGLGKDPVEFVTHPDIARKGRALLVTTSGLVGIGFGIVLLMRSSYILQLSPPNPSWLIIGMTGIVLVLMGLVYAITGVTSIIVQGYDRFHTTKYHRSP